MSDVLADRLTVTVGQHTYDFRMPSIRFDIEVGYRAADVRRRAYPEGMGALGAVDFSAVQFSRACAYLELYLIGASTLWPYGIADDHDLSRVDPAKPPKVDFEKFPISAADLVLEVGAAFEDAYGRFRRPGLVNGRSAGTETVAGKPDPGAP